jgi:enoyl-[acyl-carrier protein] reductase/trans-2-enoyl-CoA reductase (NAD+)
LVIGASTGFGLASRITSAFGSNAGTISVLKPPTEGKQLRQVGTTLQHLNKRRMLLVCMQKCQRRCLSNEVKQQTINLIKADLGKWT